MYNDLSLEEKIDLVLPQHKRIQDQLGHDVSASLKMTIEIIEELQTENKRLKSELTEGNS